MLDTFDRSLCNLTPPRVEVVEHHPGWYVARDDLLLGGTKSRVLAAVLRGLGWERGRPVVYAGPAQGGMQIALAAHATVDAHLFYGDRPKKGLHPRQREVLTLGGQHHYSPYPSVRPTQVKALAKRWAEEHDAVLLRWGLMYGQVIDTIAEVTRATRGRYGGFDEIWVAGGSGTLATGIALGSEGDTEVHVVPIGRTMKPDEAEGCVVHAPTTHKMDEKVKLVFPFPCDPYYDGKAWGKAIMTCFFHDETGRLGKSRLFWNVIAPPPEHES